MTDRRDFLTAAALALASSQGASSMQAKPPRAQPLPAPFDNMDASFVEVTVQPGPGSRSHRHAGFVLGYVLEGEYRFAINDEPPRTLRAGELFYEPPGSRHTSSASASPDKPARILAIIIHERGKQLTTVE